MPVSINRRILLQVTAPAVGICVLLFGSVLVGIRSINHLESSRAMLLSKNVHTLQYAQEMEIRLRQARFHGVEAVMDPSPQRRRLVEDDYALFERAYARARECADDPALQRLLDEIGTGYRRYREGVAGPERPPGPGSGVDDYLKWADAHPVRQLLGPCEELVRLSRDEMERNRREAEEAGDRARATMLWLGTLGALGGVVGGFGVAWGLSRSITRLSVRLHDVRAHLDRDLGTVRVAAEGDLHHVEGQLEQVVSRVREVVAQVQEREREAVRAEHLAAVGQLAAGVAHEVRNPLAGVKLLVGAALKADPPEALTREDLQVIYGEVERLERRVQALLDFARPAEPRRRPSDLRAVVERALELVRARARQQRVEVEAALPAGPLPAEVDDDQFAGVLVNLFLNALDAMPHGGRLAVKLEAGPAGTAALTVEDTGRGIDPAVAGKLFTPFASTKPTGTGLGLSVCRRVIQEHGGTLAGANRPEGGARFTVTLPATGGRGSHAALADRR